MDVHVAIGPCFGVGFRQIFFVGLVDIDEAVFVVIIARIAVGSGDLAQDDARVAHRLGRLAAKRCGGFEHVSGRCGDPPGEVPGLGVAGSRNLDAVPRTVVVGVGEGFSWIAHLVVVCVGEKFLGPIVGAVGWGKVGKSFRGIPNPVAVGVVKKLLGPIAGTVGGGKVRKSLPRVELAIVI